MWSVAEPWPIKSFCDVHGFFAAHLMLLHPPPPPALSLWSLLSSPSSAALFMESVRRGFYTLGNICGGNKKKKKQLLKRRNCSSSPAARGRGDSGQTAKVYWSSAHTHALRNTPGTSLAELRESTNTAHTAQRAKHLLNTTVLFAF